MKLKSENQADEFQTYAGAFKCGGAESLIPEEVESKREEKNVEKLKSKSKKERRKCKEAANKKPEVSKQSFRSRLRSNMVARKNEARDGGTRGKRELPIPSRVLLARPFVVTVILLHSAFFMPDK